jgi:hypothetical protein
MCWISRQEAGSEVAFEWVDLGSKGAISVGSLQTSTLMDSGDTGSASGLAAALAPEVVPD